MSYQKDREEFIAVLVSELTPKYPTHEVMALARSLMRKASTSQRIAEMLCSVEMSERRQARIEKQDESNDAAIERLCKQYGLECRLQGDPRGYTVKVILPSGRYNTWGGEPYGWGVPARDPRLFG